MKADATVLIEKVKLTLSTEVQRNYIFHIYKIHILHKIHCELEVQPSIIVIIKQ